MGGEVLVEDSIASADSSLTQAAKIARRRRV
jgi:hypothetical protein